MGASFGDEVIGEDLDREAPLTLTLDSRGNPDFGQNPDHPVYGVPGGSMPVSSLREASRRAREYIEQHDLGGGNWTGGDVLDRRTGQLVAHVSYNGRVWRPECCEDEATPCRP